MSDPYIFNIQMLQSQLSTANREITRLRARVTELERKLEKEKDEVKRLQEQLDEASLALQPGEACEIRARLHRDPRD